MLNYSVKIVFVQKIEADSEEEAKEFAQNYIADGYAEASSITVEEITSND